MKSKAEKQYFKRIILKALVSKLTISDIEGRNTPKKTYQIFWIEKSQLFFAELSGFFSSRFRHFSDFIIFQFYNRT